MKKEISLLLAAITGEIAFAVNIDCGRQLFVDDALIESTNGVVRHWNRPVKNPSPVLRPTASDGSRVAGCTVATDGGLWWDPTIKRYRLWYETNWAGVLRYAESKDGIDWTLPDLGVVKGTNRVFTDAEQWGACRLDSWNVWPNYKSTNPYADWKLLISAPGGHTTDTLFSSADGRHFKCLGVAGYSGDRTTLFFDPFRDKWIFSLRDYHKPIGRARRYFEQDEFMPSAAPYGKPFAKSFRNAPSNAVEAAIWREFDTLEYGPRGSLYSFDAVAYESLMLGVMEVLHNTPRDNTDSEEAGLPKQTSLRFAFSRDGKTYTPAPESALRPEGWGTGKWDTGYLSAVGGICTVSDDEIRIYYSALRGDAELSSKKIGRKAMHLSGIYYNGAIGFATLRRDGFCGLVADGKGEILTKPVAFSGRRLFVNAECLYGEVAAELRDEKGLPIRGFTFADCRQMKFDDSTKRELVFAGGSLSQLAGRNVRICFSLHCATLYSFWVSPSERGESRGYVAAGGPDYPGLRDTREETPDWKPEGRWRGFNLLGMFRCPTTGLKPDPRVDGHFSEWEFKALRDWGFNFARLPIDYRILIKGDDWSNLDEAKMKLVDQAIEWGRKYGIHVQVALHRIPGYCILDQNEAFPLGTSPVAQKAACEMWAKFAKRWKAIPNENLSFNLFNEPVRHTSGKAYPPLAKKLIEAIRAEDSRRFVMVDGNNCASLPVKELYSEPAVGQAFRGYTPHAISHYGADYIDGIPKELPTWPLQPNYGSKWVRKSPEETLRMYLPAIEAGEVCMVGEFGARNKTPHAVTLAWMEHCLKLWKQHNLGWALWNLRGVIGILDSERADVEYEDYHGHKLDRKMLELLQRY